MGWAIGGGFLLIWVLSLWQSLSRRNTANSSSGAGFADTEGFALNGGLLPVGTDRPSNSDEMPALLGGMAVGVSNNGIFFDEDNYGHLIGRVEPVYEGLFDVNPATGLSMMGAHDTDGNLYGTSHNFNDPF